MSEKKTEDHLLDELLNNMPRFTDNRPKDEIYQQVNSVIENQEKMEKRNRFGASVNKWMPFIISVASVLILTVLVSSYINNNSNSTADKAAETSMADHKMSSLEETDEATMEMETETEDSNDYLIMSTDENAIELVPLETAHTSVYDGDLNEGTVFRFSMLENALSVPITIVIPKEQLDMDFPDSFPNSLELYEKYASVIDETALGFQEYHPYQGDFTAEGKTLKHYLPAGHGYDTAPGTAAPYISSINEIFTDFDSFARVNEDGSPIEWDQVGTLVDPVALKGTENKVNYFAYKAFNGDTYLTPNFNKTFETLSEALMDMKNPVNDIYTSVIPKDANFVVREDKTYVVQFDKPLDLDALGVDEGTRLIEAFSLTAASFNQSIQLDNVLQENWNGFDLTNPLPVPIGPNGFTMNTK